MCIYIVIYLALRSVLCIGRSSLGLQAAGCVRQQPRSTECRAGSDRTGLRSGSGRSEANRSEASLREESYKTDKYFILIYVDKIKLEFINSLMKLYSHPAN